MRPVVHRTLRGAHRRDAGYALLMVIFMVASLILMTAMVTPRVLTEGRREKEAELVWRGKQYTRAVRLFYQKNGRFPQTIEELSKPSQTGAHYLRKIYKDPVNGEDGKWRFIYVSPSGQLIGSVNYASLQDMAAKLGLGIAAGGNAGSPLSTQSGNSSDSSQAAGANAAAQQGIAQSGAAQSGQTSQTGQTTSSGQAQTTTGQLGQTGQTGQGQSSSPFTSGFDQPTPVAQLKAVDGPVLGGFVIGVGSKVKKDSLQVYQGADSYAKWEFIFNPLSMPGAAAGPAAAGVGGTPSPTQGAPGAGIGSFGLPGSTAAGNGGPGAPPPSPGPTPSQPNPVQ